MSAQRMLFIVIATVILSGISLTGFSQVHWLLYVPVAGMLFAAASGFCPGIALLKKWGLNKTKTGCALNIIFKTQPVPFL